MGENNAPIACHRQRGWRLERNSPRIDWRRSTEPIQRLRPAAVRRAPDLAAPPPEDRVPAPPPWGRMSFFFLSFSGGSSHGTVQVAYLAEEVAAADAVGPAALIDSGNTGRTYGPQFPAPGHIPGRRESPRGHGGGLQQRRQARSRGRQHGTAFYFPEQPERAAG